MSEADRELIPQYLLSQAEAVDPKGEFHIISLKEDAKFDTELYIRVPVILFWRLRTDVVFRIKELCVIQTEFHMNNMHVMCQIRASGKAHFVCENCTFEPNPETGEPPVDVFAASVSKFKNCKFINATKGAIRVADRSSIECDNCTFTGTEQTALTVLENAQCILANCTFSGPCHKHAVYLYRESEAEVTHCTFTGIQGRAISGLDHVKMSITSSKFENCHAGGAVCADGSLLQMIDCYMCNIGGSGCQAVKDSQLVAFRCFWNECNGSALHYELSTGLVDSCLFRKMGAPVILCYGPQSNPVISNSHTEEMMWPSVVARDCATPVLYNCKFAGAECGCATITDFSHPVFAACTFHDCSGNAVVVANGAKPMFCGCSFKNCSRVIYTFNLSSVLCWGNNFVDCEELFRADDQATIKLERLNIRTTGEVSCAISMKADMSVVNEDEISDPEQITGPIVTEYFATMEADNTFGQSLVQERPFPGVEVRPPAMSNVPIRAGAPSRFQFDDTEESSQNSGIRGPPRISSETTPRQALRETSTMIVESTVAPVLRAPPAPRKPPESNTDSETQGTDEVPGKRLLRSTFTAQNIEGKPVSRSSRQLKGPQASRVLARDAAVQSERRETLRPSANSVQHINRVRVQDRPTYRTLQVKDLAEVTALPIPESDIGDAVEVINELKDLETFIGTLSHRTAPQKKKRLEVSQILAEFNAQSFAPSGVIKCHGCDQGANTICSPCGHHIWCEECAHKALNASKCAMCPKCASKVVKTSKVFPSENCLVCMDKAPDTTILPCGHKCICYECSISLWNKRKQCPMCCTRVASFRHDFPV